MNSWKSNFPAIKEENEKMELKRRKKISSGRAEDKSKASSPSRLLEKLSQKFTITLSN